MLNTISIVFAHPRQYLKILKIKTYKIIIALLLFILVSTFAIIPNLLGNTNITSNESNDIADKIVVAAGDSFNFSNNTLSTNPFVISTNSMDYYFLATPSNESITALYAVYGSQSVSVYVAGVKIKKIAYSASGISAFTSQDLKNTNLLAEGNLRKLLNLGYKEASYFQVPLVIASEFLSNIIYIAIGIIFIYLISKYMNPKLPSIYRFRVSLFSSFIYVYTILISYLFGSLYLSLIGVFLSYIYAAIALKSFVVTYKKL